MALELNKLEPAGPNCRAYMVITNKADSRYESLKLDLIEFRTDGIIGHRFAIQLGPVRPNKQQVKLFDIAGSSCTDIGSFLVNDILECRTSSGPIDDCFSKLTLSSRTEAQLSK
ncbi:hypothetical protein HT051_04275 [Methyloligella sp. GL2]|nr:hypothetical protein HT051_04275 [Methyloligella sp. GL2]